MKYGRLFALLMAAAVTATSFSYGAAVPVAASELMEDEDILVTEPEDEEGVYDLTTDGAMGTENEEEGSIDSYDMSDESPQLHNGTYYASQLTESYYWIENDDVTIIMDQDKELTGIDLEGGSITFKGNGTFTLTGDKTLGIPPLYARNGDIKTSINIESGKVIIKNDMGYPVFGGKEFNMKGGEFNVIPPEASVDGKYGVTASVINIEGGVLNSVVSTGNGQDVTVNVTGGTLNAKGTKYGIGKENASDKLNLNISGGTVIAEATASESGVYAINVTDLKITGGRVEAKVSGTTDGYAVASDTIDIKPGIKTPAGGKIGTHGGKNTVMDGSDVPAKTVVLGEEIKTYKVTVSYDRNKGIASATPSSGVEEGKPVKLSATANSGYEFDKWTSNDVTVTNPSSATEATFNMPGKDVTVTASFKEKTTPAGTYAVKYVYKDASKLPAAVTATLPTDTGAYKDGTVVKAKDPSKKSIEVSDGTWTFMGWDAASKTIKGAAVTFTGTWVFTKKGEPVPTPTPAPVPREEQMGKDGTPLGEGASIEAAEKEITTKAIDNKDPKGAKILPLKVNASKVTDKKITLKWTKNKKAVKYVIYGNKCGKKNKMKKLTTAKKGKTKAEFSKIAGKKIKKGTYYKFMIVALDKNNDVISTSKVVHAATKGGKLGNTSKLTVSDPKNKKVNIKVGKTKKLKIKETKDKKLTVKKHVAVRYESSNPKVAKVDSKGKIKGLKKGKADVIVYCQNGISQIIKVTVK